MQFEWDENKRKLNLKKHNTDFAWAIAVFSDPNRIDKVDDRKNYGEVRIITIGAIEAGEILETVVVVVSTDRKGNIRIISARRANKKEKSYYYDNS